MFNESNVDDRKVVPQLMSNLSGLSAGDKGYLSEKFFLGHRGLVETVIEQLKSICHIEHSRHRSPINFIVHLVAGLADYCLKPNKPALKIKYSPPKALPLIHN